MSNKYQKEQELQRLKTRIQLAEDCLHWANNLICLYGEPDEKTHSTQFRLYRKYQESLTAFSRFEETK